MLAHQQGFPPCLVKFVNLMQPQLVDLWESTCYPLIEKHKNYRTESAPSICVIANLSTTRFDRWSCMTPLPCFM